MKLKRTFYLMKSRTHVLTYNLAEKLFKFLAKCHLVIEHRRSSSYVRDLTSPQSVSDIHSDRFVFEASYILKKIEFIDEYWFTNKKGKKLFVVCDNSHKSYRVCFRANLKSFLCHFSPRQKMWVHRHSPVVYLHSERIDFSKPQQDPFAPVGFKTHQCDFSQCRFAFEFTYAPYPLTHGVSFEVLAESQKVLKRELTSKVSEINKILTGASYDGEMMSPKNMPLSQNLLCRHCGLPVFASAKDKYKFECLCHGELDYEWVRRVDPVEYEKVLGYTFDTLEALIHKSCPQDSNL